MLGTSLGPWDPAGFDENDPQTFPPTPPGGFAAGQFYVLTGPTTAGGVQLVAGDRLYVAHGIGRTMGTLTLGDLHLGGDGWDVAYVHWLPHSTTAPPWDHLAPPYAGCPFFPLADTGLTEADPQWRIIVEGFYTDLTTTRLLGTGTFGSDVLGGDPTTAAVDWVDITEPSFAITIAVGDPEGGFTPPSTQITWEVSDPTEDYIHWQVPVNLYSPQVHTPIRVSLQDPNFQVYPLAVGRIERIEDEHDLPPRTVTVEAFGLMTDLVQHAADYDRPQENTDERIEAILSMAGWQWGDLTIDPAPGEGTMTLTADPLDPDNPDPRELRAELQLAAISNRWTADCDRFGRIRARTWPLEGVGPDLHVADCPDDAPQPSLVTESILLVADTAELLNRVTLENRGQNPHLDPPSPPDIRDAEDITSIGRYGVHDTAYGFPLTGLHTLSRNNLQLYADRIVARLARIVNRVDGVVGNIAHDPDWLQAIAEIDTGRRVVVHRVGIPNREVTIEAVTVGYEIRLGPGQANIDIHTQSTTTTV